MLFMLESKYDQYHIQYSAFTETGKVIWGWAVFCFT